MKTDALYLSLFETTPSLALRLAGCPLARASEYTCQSQEFKRTFRVDAVLLPPSFSLPLLLMEVQFQRDTDIYHRLVASGAIARIQYAEYDDIRMVLLFASRSVDAGVVQVVYLDQATARIPLEHCTVAEQASLLLARVTVSPFDRALDDRFAEEFGRILAPLRSGSSGEVLLYKAFKDFCNWSGLKKVERLFHSRNAYEPSRPYRHIADIPRGRRRCHRFGRIVAERLGIA